MKEKTGPLPQNVKYTVRPARASTALTDSEKEAELLEELPLPGNPVAERERKAKWLELPRRARIAIRRLHRNMRLGLRYWRVTWNHWHG